MTSSGSGFGPADPRSSSRSHTTVQKVPFPLEGSSHGEVHVFYVGHLR